MIRKTKSSRQRTTVTANIESATSRRKSKKIVPPILPPDIVQSVRPAFFSDGNTSTTADTANAPIPKLSAARRSCTKGGKKKVCQDALPQSLLKNELDSNGTASSHRSQAANCRTEDAEANQDCIGSATDAVGAAMTTSTETSKAKKLIEKNDGKSRKSKEQLQTSQQSKRQTNSSVVSVSSSSQQVAKKRKVQSLTVSADELFVSTADVSNLVAATTTSVGASFAVAGTDAKHKKQKKARVGKLNKEVSHAALYSEKAVPTIDIKATRELAAIDSSEVKLNGSDKCAVESSLDPLNRKLVSKKRQAKQKSKRAAISGDDLTGSSNVDSNSTDNNIIINNPLKVERKHKKKKEKKEETSVDRENGENIEYALKWGADPEFSGNEDDAGSVVSGVLDEDICYFCGVSTLNNNSNSSSSGSSSSDCDWSSVIICDTCDGEYHLSCEQLTAVPAADVDYKCRKCTRDEAHFSTLDFDVAEQFKLSYRGAAQSVVYSPSKPLPLAWLECLRKGLMVVSDLLPHDTMSKLTHGVVLKQTSKGRIAELWNGAAHEVTQRLSNCGCHGIVDREGRYDLKLPEYVVQQLQLEQLLAPVLDLLRSIMGSPEPKLRTHNVVFVPVGSRAQRWHVDDRCSSASSSSRKGKKKKGKHRYFTVLVHLNPLDCNSGGTEVWLDDEKKGDLIRARPGDALVFPGSLLHRGHANNGSSHRFFYYASFACGADANTGGD